MSQEKKVSKGSLQVVADFMNGSSELDIQGLEELIESVGAVSDLGTVWGICHNETEKVILNENCVAICVSVKI